MILRLLQKLGLLTRSGSEFDKFKKEPKRPDKSSMAEDLEWLTGIAALVLYQGMVIACIIIWGTTEFPVQETAKNQEGSVYPISKPEIDWENIQAYFSVRKPSFEEGFSQMGTRFRFLLTANGDFGGRLHLYAFDRDGAIICPSSPSPQDCLSYDLGHHLIKMLDQGGYDDPAAGFWRKGQAIWAQVYLPFNTDRLQLNFTQIY